ncbi:IMP-specific 5'-nucleotidase 1, related [Eimeria tenella]|uniref:IMP-specific 5'-nucleotidase 1 n=1 Tax=Eimeria tenella TaxID=5802 RepID=U6KLB9_EIMTE|nr:IMP-specific 5'-nucleotidase 1, related [Eimeria tenella]CDJ37062.1 IMP-specific 5'-nucleotidase 1, related [Eimeria tenella]|eukprot:XP_013227900.1 IMP-specific 5'-nucleotidase 1, related [Eimeria tenella]
MLLAKCLVEKELLTSLAAAAAAAAAAAGVRFGCVDNKGMHKETLEEAVMRIRRDIRMAFGADFAVPYSVFSGGCDIWVDAGNKAEGVALLQGLLQLLPQQCLHVGDQFSLVGNDLAARICSPALWIRNPRETAAVLQELLAADTEEEDN